MSPRYALLALSAVTLSLVYACHGSGEGAPGDGGIQPSKGGDAGLCSGLFGNPNSKTGLTLAECAPECLSENFSPPVYDAGFIDALVTDWRLATPYAPITTSPYDGGTPTPDPEGTVCAVLPRADTGSIPRLYDLVTYASADLAEAAGAKVTHFGGCGVCSTLSNLAVYMAQNDLTAPVRACGIANPAHDADVACLEQLGFDEPCADAWAYDTDNTRNVCLLTCLTRVNAPYNLPDGGLDPCIQCDEDLSGPVFKAVAGRTRRNSGLPNAICRPCSQVQPLVHSY